MTTRVCRAGAAGLVEAEAVAAAVVEVAAEAVVVEVVEEAEEGVVAAAVVEAAAEVVVAEEEVVAAEEEVAVEAEVAAVVAEVAEDRKAAASTATKLVSGEIQPWISPVRLQRAQRGVAASNCNARSRRCPN